MKRINPQFIGLVPKLWCYVTSIRALLDRDIKNWTKEDFVVVGELAQPKSFIMWALLNFSASGSNGRDYLLKLKCVIFFKVREKLKFWFREKGKGHLFFICFWFLSKCRFFFRFFFLLFLLFLSCSFSFLSLFNFKFCLKCSYKKSPLKVKLKKKNYVFP